MAKSHSVTDLSDDDLVKGIADTKQELFNLRFQNATGQLDNYARLTTTKRQVARLMTELRAREIRAAEALEASQESN